LVVLAGAPAVAQAHGRLVDHDGGVGADRGLSGSAVLAMLTLAGALGVHLCLRQTR
jgi:hypothetical protein